MPSPRLERQFGRQAFGEDPAGYHGARPAYPEWVFEMLISRCGLRRNIAAFEIGAGTGKATSRLLELGADPLTVVEPDQRLDDFLRSNNTGSALKILVAAFEDAELEEQAFDLGVSATSFHWLDEANALSKIVRLLRPADGGRQSGTYSATTAGLIHFMMRPGDCSTARSVLRCRPAFPLRLTARLAALRATGGFDIVDHSISRWPLVLDADQTVALYATFSNITAHPDRQRVLAELGRIARDEFGGRVIRNMTTSLYIARRA
jgi:SAM-dependent methyltransferase